MGLNGRCSILGRGKIILSSIATIPVWSLSSLRSKGHTGLFPWGIKQPGHEADHYRLSSAEIKKDVTTLSSPYLHMS
jgi:hypothetical protein